MLLMPSRINFLHQLYRYRHEDHGECAGSRTHNPSQFVACASTTTAPVALTVIYSRSPLLVAPCIEAEDSKEGFWLVKVVTNSAQAPAGPADSPVVAGGGAFIVCLPAAFLGDFRSGAKKAVQQVRVVGVLHAVEWDWALLGCGLPMVRGLINVCSWDWWLSRVLSPASKHSQFM